jgi:hypothetical protein
MLKGIMGPVTQHLRAALPDLPQPCVGSSLYWNFNISLKALAPAFYNKIVPLHPLLNVEYSILCNQLRQDFLFPKKEQRQQVTERLNAALMFCELLEHIHQHYLVVPREVVRLRKQQQLFRTLLFQLAGYTFAKNLDEKEAIDINFSLSQRIRDLTIQTNWYRILINRSKRVVNLLNIVITDSQSFNTFVNYLDKYANPLLGYFGLLFHVPRLLGNLFLIIKHTVPGSWMSDKESSLSWTTRLFSQIQSCWFEIGNDAVWTLVSALNLFLLLGSLASGAVYVSAVAFAFDAVNAAARAYVELNRLYSLQDDYQKMLTKESNLEKQESIRTHLKHIENRIHFEHLRFGLHVSGTVLICAAMALTLPILAVSPPVLLASAIFLLLLWAINFTLTRKLDNYRPNETIEVPTASVSQLGVFATKKRVHSPGKENKILTDFEIVGLTSSPPLNI